MQEPRRPEVASYNHTAGNGSHSGTSTRMLSVDEALQYSPFSSTTTYGLDSITLPQVGRPGPLSLFATPAERTSARKAVDNLDYELRKSNGRSTYLDSTLEELTRFLDGDEVTEFKFKSAPNHDYGVSQVPSRDSNGLPETAFKFGPLGKMVLDSTDVAFICPTPKTPTSKNTKSTQRPATTPTSNGVSHHGHNQQALARNALPTPESVSSDHSTSQIEVLITALPSASKYRNLVKLPPAAGKAPETVKTTQPPTSSLAKNREEEADTAISQFEELLQAIFDAEDELQADLSSGTLPESNAFFLATNSETSPYAITVGTHRELRSYMRKLVGYNRFGDIPLDALVRLQNLCERPLSVTQTLAVQLDSGSSDSDIEDWLQKLKLADYGLSSAATLIRMMMSNRGEKELRPEEIILCIPNALSNIFENCVTQVVEARSQGPTSGVFSTFMTHKETLGSLMKRAKEVLVLLSTLVSKIEVVEEAVTTTEFLATKLLFVENAHSEKESILGIAKYEAVRRSAMEALAKIFSRYPEQRNSILDETLASWGKLPQTQKSARQYKLADGKNIQLVTALVMQLVQTSTLQIESFSSRKPRRVLNTSRNSNVDEMEIDNEEDEQNEDEFTPRAPNGLAAPHATSGLDNVAQVLATKFEHLHENALRSAQYVVGSFVQRAMNSSKTGDEPYRNLLDLFTEDLLLVLTSTDWPAAEFILRLLAAHMIRISNHDKSTALAKNMALEVLGWMGGAISDTFASLERLGSAIDRNSSKTTEYLYWAIHNQLHGTSTIEDVTNPQGPFRITLKYLQERNVDDWQLSSARSFFLIQWAKTVSNHLQALDEDQTETEKRSTRHRLEETASLLIKMLSDPKWIETESDFDPISTNEGRAAYNLTMLNLGFCKAYDAIVSVLLGSLTSDQIKIRNRSLKSVVTMLEKDPNLLERQSDILKVIFRCASDKSSLVRDSALSLIGKCVLLKPGLEDEACRLIMRSMGDQAVMVRKRSIGLLKDMYLRTPRMDLKTSIAESLLLRMKDPEDSVRDLARQMIEDTWFSPYLEVVASLNESAKAKVAFREHAALMVRSVQRGGDVVACFELFLGKVISLSSKNATSNIEISKALVATMFDALAEGSDFPGKIERNHLLQTITTFAKCDPKVFSPEQLRFLQPYIGNLKSQDDLFLFKSAVIIFRSVLPSLSAAQNGLLKDVQDALFRSISTLGRPELNEVMACLWTINGVLQNPRRLVNLSRSTLEGIQRDSRPQSEVALNRLKSYAKIAGSIGKCFDLEKHSAAFRDAFQWWKGGSVAGLIVDLLTPFIPSTQPLALRIVALESLGLVCQSWPAQFSKNAVRNLLDSVFAESNADLQNIILKIFAEFFTIHEGKRERVANFDGPDEADHDSRFDASLKASDTDGAVAMIAQHFLKNIIHVCSSRQDLYGLTAIQVIASINRQGLVHPKECAGIWVASETSTNKDIANIAYETHKKLHQQHETMFEREYMRAVHDAFIYQRDVVGDCSGATKNPYRSKLWPLFDIVKISNTKYQKKFLANLCSKIKFEPEKLDYSRELPDYLLYARFLIQNLAFFEYARMEELVHAISCMEKVVAETGTEVAHAIDTELFNNIMDVPGEEDPAVMAGQTPTSVDHKRLKQMTTSTIILTMLWEARTFLRRLYGVSSSNALKKGSQAKDMNKAPARVHGITGDRFWESMSQIMGALTNEETMISQCQEFSKLLSIDDEVKLAAENEGERESLDSGSVDPEDGTPVSSLRKRKGSRSASGTPKKPRKRGRPSSSNRRKSSVTFDDNADGWDQ